jgi:S-adenosylmethionine synthetase
MCLVLASILNLPHKHIVPITEPPNDGVTRPKDCHLSMKVVETDLGMDSLDFEPFDDWWREWLGKASS